MAVGLFGFYDHGNFGDDLMALLFSSALREAGHRVVSSSCRPELAEECGIDVVDSIESLVDEADAIVYGGGGILVPHTMEAGSRYSAYRTDITTLLRHVERTATPLAAFSIGGTGFGHDALPAPVEALIRPGVLSSCTLRLHGDRAHFGADVPPPPVFPDVVLHTSVMFPFIADRSEAEDDRYAIGVNVGNRSIDRRLCMFLRLMQKGSRHIDVKYFDTFTEDSPVRAPEMYSADESENVRYRSVRRHLEAVASVDMLFTHKLHIGVAAVSYGIPIVSWVGASKARSFLSEVGAEGASVGPRRRDAPLLLTKMLASGGRCPASCGPDPARLAHMRVQSARHVEEMLSWIDLVVA